MLQDWFQVFYKPLPDHARGGPGDVPFLVQAAALTASSASVPDSFLKNLSSGMGRQLQAMMFL